LCATIDVVRATTTLAVIGERGGRAVRIARDVTAARRFATESPAALLVGELGGRVPAGFDYSNSPATLAEADLAGREFIFATTNGTRAIVDCQEYGAGGIVAASLRNATAIARLALAQPADGVMVIVCSGRSDRVALDDTYTAGVIVAIAQRLAGDTTPLECSERALMAAAIAQTAGEPLAVLRRSEAGLSVIAIGMDSDLISCATLDATAIIPRVQTITQGDAMVIGFA